MLLFNRLLNCEFHVYAIYTSPHMLTLGLHLASPHHKAQYPMSFQLPFQKAHCLRFFLCAWLFTDAIPGACYSLMSSVSMLPAVKLTVQVRTRQNYSACLSAGACVSLRVSSHFTGYILSTHLGSSEFIILVTSNDLENTALVRKAPQDSAWSSHTLWFQADVQTRATCCRLIFYFVVVQI